ncbi:MAG: c-type cytochrome [Armatimonadetes bacterium]|nr:c-type cytochrome [Armatimonadota bacterium]
MAARNNGDGLVVALGLSLWTLLGLQVLIGVLLSTQYSSAIGEAHGSVAAIGRGGFWGFLAGFHYWGSAVTILLAGLNLAVLLWYGRNGWDSRWLWWGAIGIAVIAVMFQMTGNLLPGSAHDVRTAFKEASIASAAPVMGRQLFEATLGGIEVGQSTFDRWYFAHRFAASALLILLAIPCLRAALRLRVSGLWRWAPVAVIVVGAALAVGYGAPHGPTAGAEDFASQAVKPMWYVLPMHALLNISLSVNPSLSWVGAMLLPALGFGSFALVPLLWRKGLPAVFGRLALLAGTAMMVFAVLTYGQQLQSPFSETAMAEGDAEPAGDFGQIDTALAKVGREEFLEAGCLGCHSVGGEGLAVTGPNLGHVGDEHQDPDWFVEKLRDPASKSPGTTMPSFADLGDEKLRALAEYLRSLRASDEPAP